MVEFWEFKDIVKDFYQRVLSSKLIRRELISKNSDVWLKVSLRPFKSTKDFGRIILRRNVVNNTFIKIRGVIQINRELLNQGTPDHLENCLVHELAHLLEYVNPKIKYKARQGHKRASLWYKIAQTLMQEIYGKKFHNRNYSGVNLMKSNGKSLIKAWIIDKYDKPVMGLLRVTKKCIKNIKEGLIYAPHRINSGGKPSELKLCAATKDGKPDISNIIARFTGKLENSI